MSSTSTPIDEARFLAAYAEHHGEPYSGDVPPTLEALFDAHHDPDEFYAETTSTLHAARAAMFRERIELSDDPHLSGVTVFPGDVHARSNFTFGSHVLVLGDLVVDGVLSAPPAHSILMVAGSVRCRAIELVRAYVFTTGDVVAREAFLGCLYGFTKVAGRLETRLYLHDDTWANYPLDACIDEESTFANVTAGTIVDIEAPDARAALARVLVPGALGGDKEGFGEGNEDIYELFAKLARGETILQA